MRILLVEDDGMIAQAVAAGLKHAGYAADHAADGETAESALRAQNYDLMLLDLGLPKKDGLQVLQRIRQSGQTLPVLVLTARDDLDSRLAGVDGGADDYIVKPFDMAELLARIRAVLRRRMGHATAVIGNGLMTLDPASRQVRIKGQPESIPLSSREFAVLHALLARAGVIHSRADLEDKVYPWGEEVESNAIDFLIHALRKKLGKDSIKNVRGVGWLVDKADGAP